MVCQHCQLLLRRNSQLGCTWPLWLQLAVGWGRCCLLGGEVLFCLQEAPNLLFVSSSSIGLPDASRQSKHFDKVADSHPPLVHVLSYSHFSPFPTQLNLSNKSSKQKIKNNGFCKSWETENILVIMRLLMRLLDKYRSY